MTSRRQRGGASPSPTSFHVEFEGSVYEVDVADIAFVDAVRIRVASGMSREEFATAMQVGFDPELIAGLVWVVARADGRPDLAYQEVLKGLTMGSVLDGDEAAEAAKALVPKSEGASSRAPRTTRTTSA